MDTPKPPEAVSRLVPDPGPSSRGRVAGAVVINEDVEFRQFSCPGCGTLSEHEVAVTSAPVLEDIRPACAVPVTETT